VDPDPEMENFLWRVWFLLYRLATEKVDCELSSAVEEWYGQKKTTPFGVVLFTIKTTMIPILFVVNVLLTLFRMV